MSRPFHIVVAGTESYGIGYENHLPWNAPNDLKYFKELTSKTVDPNKKNAVIMGRKTWESIPDKFRPLKDRVNIVVTSRDYIGEGGYDKDVRRVRSLNRAIEVASVDPRIENIFVIGGARLYEEAICHPLCHVIHYTIVKQDCECDAFFPPIDLRIFTLAFAKDIGKIVFCRFHRMKKDSADDMPIGCIQ